MTENSSASRNIRRKKILIHSIVALTATILVLSAVIRCALLIQKNYTYQLKQNLADVSIQCGETIETQVESRYCLLESISNDLLLEGDDRIDVVSDSDSIVEAFNLKRIWFVEKDGTAYGSDGGGDNVSYRDFFKEGMNGNTYVSDVLVDKMDPNKELVFIMSMPMKNPKDEIVGVAGITYDIEVLNEDMAIKSFEGYGDNFVINQNGNVIISSNENILPINSNIASINFKIAENELGVSKALSDSVANSTDTEGKIFIDEEECYFHITPVSIMEGTYTWYVLSIVPNDYLMARFFGVKRNLIRMVIIVLFIIFITVYFMRKSYTKQRRIAYSLAYKSHMTGGPNLDRFFETMNYEKDIKGYIIYLNIEDFTHTEVATGVEKSNRLIKEIWKIVKSSINDNEQACHDKADCFVLFVRENNREHLTERLGKLRDTIREAGHAMKIPWVYPKFGVCEVGAADDVKNAYSKAEYTVYDTWGKKEFISYYSEKDHERQALNKAIEENFDYALNEERFEIWLQPKYSVSDSMLTGAEALVRWRRKDGTILPPGMFIPLLEKNGEIDRLDEYVFQHTCKKIREWKERGLNTVPVSINVSRATLYRENIVETYMTILNQNNLLASDIQIEVTESIVGGSENIQRLLTEFRNNGIKILMDDFGSGYSSLSTLNMKCFDTLKIDKSLIDEIEDEYGRKIVYQTIELGYALGLYITVEGVEDASQLELLKETKSNDIQGYYFSKPMPAEEFEDILINNM